MTQLADDCFAFGGPLMETETALAILRERIVPVTETEDIPLAAALGRVLATDLVAGISVPPHDNAAVDGYALRGADLNPDGDTVLTVVERVPAGDARPTTLVSGQAARIFTGAVMPDGADTVVMQEDVSIEGDRLTVPAGLKTGANRRRAGEDSKAGDVLLTSGHRLRPQDLALAASVGHARLTVFKPLRVGVFSTGDELREPGDALPRGAVHDANRYMLLGLLHRLGVVADDLGILPDRLDAVRDALAAAAETHDLLLTSGGVSTGEEDHVKAAVEALGTLHFWRLAIKPGRPLALGQVGRVPFVGLPGNPVAAMICFLRFARPLVLGLAGVRDLEPRLYRVPAGFDMKKKEGRREWLRARLTAGDDGLLRAERFDRQGSGIINSLVASDGLVEIDEQVTRIAEGDIVAFLPFDEVMS
jgi:molybdopterin molybdotransferase